MFTSKVRANELPALVAAYPVKTRRIRPCNRSVASLVSGTETAYSFALETQGSAAKP
jgi:hypothetical protein